MTSCASRADTTCAGWCAKAGALSAVRTSREACGPTLLEFSDPNWTARIGKGAALARWGSQLLLAGLLIGGLLVGPILAGLDPSAGKAVLAVLALAWVAGTTAVFLAGIWLLTSPDPRASSDATATWTSTCCRMMGLVVVLLAACWWGLRPLPKTAQIALSALLLLTAVAWIYLIVAHIEHLAHRRAAGHRNRPQRRVWYRRRPLTLERTCRDVRILLILASLSALVLLGHEVVPSLSRATGLFGAFPFIAFLVSIGLAAKLWDLFGYAHRVFQDAAFRARTNWLAGSSLQRRSHSS